jgi:hypothetical protein
MQKLGESSIGSDEECNQQKAAQEGQKEKEEGGGGGLDEQNH